MLRLSLTLLFGLLIAVTNSEAAGLYHKGGGSSITPPPPSANEEFAGPFASWACARTSASGTCGAAAASFCNAAATGGDDTTAFQVCFNLLAAGTVKVFWVPAGTYHISSTITLHTNQAGMGMICADPATTTIQWTGSAGGTMFLFNGVSYSRFDRCTFDANTVNSAAVIIDQSWDQGPGGQSDNTNEYTDNVFKNASGVAYKCGSIAVGQCSETSLLRDQFINNGTGVILCEFNALDIWVWYSQFTNNGIGVGNGRSLPNACSTTNAGSGNFHVFNSVFQGSTIADISWGNAGIWNIRNNYSNASNAFLSSGGGNALDITLIQGNTIINPTQQLAISHQALGPDVFLDNKIKSLGSGTPIVQMGNATGDAFSMGNTFTVGTLSSTCAGSSPINMRNNPGPSRCHSYDTVGTVTDPGAPILPGTPPNLGRFIYEPAAFTGAAIQTAINNAVAGATIKPVVHLPAGVYNTSTTITVPANSDLQMIGDNGFVDAGSVINWTGGATGPVLKLSASGAGPSRATLREFVVKGNSGAADCIEIDNADQVGAKVWAEGVSQGGGGTTIGWFADGLTNALTEIHDHAAQVATNTGIAASGTVNVFLGSTFSNGINVSASSGTLNLVGFWTENPSSGSFTAGNASNSAIVSYAASQWGFPTTNPVMFTYSNFAHEGSIIGINVGSPGSPSGGPITIGNLAGSHVLGLGISGSQPSYWNNSSSPSGTTEFVNSMYTDNIGTTQLAESTVDPTFIASALNLVRTQQPTPPVDQAPGVTDVKMFRIAVAFCRYGVHVLP